MVAAWLKRDEGRCASQINTSRLRIAQRGHLRMRLPRWLRTPLSDDVGVANDHAAHSRIRAGDVHRLPGQLQRKTHGLGVVSNGDRGGHRGLFAKEQQGALRR